VTVTNDRTRGWKRSGGAAVYPRSCGQHYPRRSANSKDFQKVGSESQENRRKVSFAITPQDLKFYNADLKYDWESGDFVIMVGGNSRDVKSAKVN